MTDSTPLTAPSRATPDTHQRGLDKVSRIPVKVEPLGTPLRKPEWIRAKAPVGPAVARVKRLLREQGLATVCEEAQCPNLGECFDHGTATFMILGDVCTRRCPFCDVAHGRPQPLDPAEPEQLAQAIATLGLRYVVITSVDRDDLRDGGAGHFAACLRAVRGRSPQTRLEVLVPDFRGREAIALAAFEGAAVPDVFNHNLETVPRLYRQARPGADYQGSLSLLRTFKGLHPEVPTKSGLMLGLGEEHEEVLAVMADLRAHGCDMLTLGQYLQPSRDHLPVLRYWTPAEFDALRLAGEAMGFSNVASGAMVRSSYHADRQAAEVVTAGGRGVTLLGLIGAFFVFMALIGAVHALDQWALNRFGYAPFALINVLAMLLPSAALWAGLAVWAGQEAGPLGELAGALGPALLFGLAIAAVLAMAWLLRRRTATWVAAIVAPLLLVAAPVLVFSVLFSTLATAGPGGK